MNHISAQLPAKQNNTAVCSGKEASAGCEHASICQFSLLGWKASCQHSNIRRFSLLPLLSFFSVAAAAMASSYALVCVCQVRYRISKKTTLNLIAVVVECSRAINFSSSFMNKNAVALLTLGKYVFGVTCQFTFNSNNLDLIHMGSFTNYVNSQREGRGKKFQKIVHVQ